MQEAAGRVLWDAETRGAWVEAQEAGTQDSPRMEVEQAEKARTGGRGKRQGVGEIQEGRGG